MKRKLMFLTLAAMGFAGCNGGFKTGPGGLLYNIVVDKGGPSIQNGDFFAVNLVVKNDADSVQFSSYEQGVPFMRIMQKSQQKGDLFQGLALLSEGDSAVIKTNIDSLYKAARPAGMKGKYQIFQIKVLKVIQKGKLDEKVFEGRVNDYYTKTINTIKDKAKAAQPGKIKKYVTDNHLKVTTTPSGLMYQITQMGTGAKPAVGDTVAVNYLVKTVDGKVLETNIKEESKKANLPAGAPFKPIRFVLGMHQMIKGWDEAFQLFPKGTKATLVLPSDLAYGDNGSRAIGPFTPLVFEVELVDFVQPDPNAPKPAAPVLPAPPNMQPSNAKPAPNGK